MISIQNVEKQYVYQTASKHPTISAKVSNDFRRDVTAEASRSNISLSKFIIQAVRLKMKYPKQYSLKLLKYPAEVKKFLKSLPDIEPIQVFDEISD